MSFFLNTKSLSRAFPYRPQRYHAWDVHETDPHVVFSQESGVSHIPIVNFSEQGLCIESQQSLNSNQPGDLISSMKVIFGGQTLLCSDAKIKHITSADKDTSHRYGLRLLEGSLNIREIFSLRDQILKSENNTSHLKQQQRSPRIGKDLLQALKINASLQWKDRWTDIEIENVSQFGFGLKIAKDKFQGDQDFSQSIKVQQILENFRFVLEDKTLFLGPLRIVYTNEHDKYWSVGTFCVGGKSIPIESLPTAYKLQELKKNFSDLLEKTQKNQQIHPDFKLALNDFRYFLEVIKGYLEETEKQIQQIESLQERQMAIEAIRDFSERQLAEKTKSLISKMEKIVTKFSESEDQIHREYFQEQMLDLTNGCLVFRRAMEKPLGYAGDYELMNYLYHHTKDGNNLWEKVINSCFNKLEPAQAVRNRAEYLEDKLRKLIDERSYQSEIHILNLACGPCEEIQRYLRHQESGPQNKLHFYLLDQEIQALQYAKSKLYPLASRFEPHSPPIQFSFLQHGVKHLLKQPELMDFYPKMDLIYSAGLFDYLPKPIAKTLTALLLGMLKDNGVLILGNFQKDHPNYFVEPYFSDWFLILRTQQELMEFLPDESWTPLAHIEEEAAKTNLFLNVTKKLIPKKLA